MANQYLARLGIVMAMDTAELEKGVNKAIEETKGMARSIKTGANAAQAEIIKLKYAAEDLATPLTAVARVTREMNDPAYKLSKATKELKDEVLKQAAAYDLAAANAKKLKEAQLTTALGGGKPQGLSTYQLQALSYQTTDIVTSLAGGQNPLLVLLQQGGQLRDQFGSLKNVFEAFGKVLTFTRVVMGGMIATFAGIGYAVYKAQEELKQFNNTLALTNNYAGVTRDSFLALANATSSKLNLSVGDSRDIFNALISSGKFTQTSIAAVGEAIAKVAKLSGESADVVAKEMIPSFNGTASAAATLNEKYHFLNLQQYKYIEQLEKQGKYQEAAKYTAEKLNEALENEAKKTGILARTWTGIKDIVTAVADAFGKMGAEPTGKDRIQAAERFLRAAKMNSNSADSEQVKLAEENLKRVKEQVAAEEKIKLDSAKKVAEEAEKTKKYIEAGGDDKARALKKQNDKILSDAEFEEKVLKAEKFERFQLESEKRIRDFISQEDDKDYAEKYVFAKQHEKNIADFKKAEAAKVKQQIEEANRQQFKQYNDELIAQKAAVDVEKEKLELYQRNILMSDADYQIAVARKEAEKDIARYRANKELTEEGREKLIAQKVAITDYRESVIRLGESLKTMKDMHNAIFNGMLNALDNFVRTGKFSFKDFTKSIIQDLMSIAVKASFMKMFSGFGSMFNFGGPTGLASLGPSVNTSFPMGNAVGGSVLGNNVALVGERGPELFIPNTSGTIIPNNNLAGALGGGPTINYNGPYIANMSAIDTQSASQFLAKNKDAVWAANQSANRSMPASR